MNLELNNKVALITGSSRGIGKAIARSLHSEGCKLMLNGRNLHDLEKTAKELGSNTKYQVADVTKPEECKNLVDQVVKEYGHLDILICNVGNGSPWVTVGQEKLEEWQRMFTINFLSATNIIESAMDVLAKSHGSIVCISSIAGIESTEAPLAYSVAKAALNSYVKGMSRILSKQGSRINAIAPGNILFEGSVWEKKSKQEPDKVQKMLENEVALKRFGKASEIADFVTFIVSPKSSFTTGQIFVIDGGQVRS